MSDYICHHGILGMQWGKRNGPPYPLGQGAHSTNEEKAGWKRSLGGGRNEELYEKNQTRRERSTSNKNNKKRNPAHNRKINSKTTVGELLEDKRERELIEEQTKHKVLEGAIGGALVGLVGSAYLIQGTGIDDTTALIILGSSTLAGLGVGAAMGNAYKKKIPEMVKEAKEATQKEIRSHLDEGQRFVDLKRLRGEHSESSDMAAVNPNYPDDGYVTNCMLCTTAYEMRRRGYNVRAKTSQTGRRTSDLLKYFNMSEKDVHETRKYDEFVKMINEMPEGSRGNVMALCGPFLSAHSMVWEKVNNKIVIRDCQSNKLYLSISDSPINREGDSYEFIRTDNALINEKYIMDALDGIYD